jgi:hypothetical protein
MTCAILSIIDNLLIIYGCYSRKGDHLKLKKLDSSR